MKSKQVLILSGILAAGIGAAFYAVNKRKSAITSGDGGKAGEAVLKDFAAADLSSFAINDGKDQVAVEFKDGKWIVPSRDGFPASLTAVNELRDNAFAMRIAEVQKVGDSQLGRLKLREPGGSAPAEERGTEVTFKDATGKEAASVIIGKTLEDKQPENFMSMTPTAPKAQYVKVKGVEGVVYQAKDGFSKLQADPKGWLDKEKFFKVEKHKTVTVTGPSLEESWKLTRDKEGGDLKLDAPQAGEEFDPARATAQGSVFGYISFDDILPAAEKDKAALDKPTHTVVIETFDGLTYTVKVGAKVPPSAPPAVSDPENPPPAPAEAYYISYTVDGKVDETVPAYSVPAPTAPAEPAADASAEDKAKYEEAKKKYEADKTAWESGKKAADDAFKTGLEARKKKLTEEQAMQGRIYVVQKYTLDPIMKKRSELMKEKAADPAAPANGGAAAPSASGNGPVIRQVPSAPNPSGRIEATTPPIEVIIPPKEGEKKEEKPAAPPAPAPAPAEEKPAADPKPAEPAASAAGEAKKPE